MKIARLYLKNCFRFSEKMHNFSFDKLLKLQLSGNKRLLLHGVLVHNPKLHQTKRLYTAMRLSLDTKKELLYKNAAWRGHSEQRRVIFDPIRTNFSLKQ